MEYSFSKSLENMLQTISTGAQDWGSLHPVVVHIPIGLLFIVPLFIILGLIFQKSSKTFNTCALILLIAGTLGIFWAVSTGEQASELIKANPEILVTLEAHDHLAETIRNYFSILSALFLVYVIRQSSLSKKFSPVIHQTALILFLIIYAYCLILLSNTAHQGGKLVHHHGITSKLYSNIDAAK